MCVFRINERNKLMSSIYTNNLIDDGAGDDFRMFLLDEAARQAEISGYDIIRLTLGKADAPLHPEITKKMQDALGDMSKCNLVFPSGLPELRDALSTYYMNYAKIKVPASNILIDAGTSSIYRNIFGIILQDNPNVVLPKPYYPLYKITAELAGGNISYYSINEKSLKIDLESLKSAVNKSTRAIVINSPGNPFGNIVDENSLYEIGRLMPKGSYLIFDEIYDNVKFKKSPPVIKTLLGTDEFAHLNIIITNAFSKGYRMYSRRLGWAILPDHLVNTITTLLHHTQLTVDPVVQFGGLEALKHLEQVEELNKEHLKRWNYTHKTLNPTFAL